MATSYFVVVRTSRNNSMRSSKWTEKALFSKKMGTLGKYFHFLKRNLNFVWYCYTESLWLICVEKANSIVELKESEGVFQLLDTNLPYLHPFVAVTGFCMLRGIVLTILIFAPLVTYLGVSVLIRGDIPVSPENLWGNIRRRVTLI